MELSKHHHNAKIIELQPQAKIIELIVLLILLPNLIP